jgi:[acyl-carrier-protein] S-malonyltransferase
MARVAALFPGQGSQQVGMGRDLAERWESAAEVFETADRAYDGPLSSICWQGPEEALRLTETTQPALLTHSIAAWRVLADAGIEVGAVAGHSLGEYSAVVAAGGLDVADAVATVRLRGRLMQRAVPVGEGAMAAILGLEDDDVTAACRDEHEASGEIVVAANFNSPGQVVIAGSVAGVEGACGRCSERGAKRAVLLPVSAPFHSPLMAPAREGLAPHLASVELSDLEIPVYRNVDARPVRSATEVRDGLIRQVDAPVRWSDTVRRLREDGFDTFLEVGTGSVLCGLVRRVDRQARCLPAGTVDAVEAAIAELGSGA